MTHDLLNIARLAMLSQGLEPDFSDEAMKELSKISKESIASDASLPDLTQLPWCSIDNDDSMDLDQITVSESLDGGRARILVAIADVAGAVKLGGPLDQHAKTNTTSVYTGVCIFPMLPEKLSTDLTSLSAGEIRNASVVEMVVNSQGDVDGSKVYRARVRNQAKLAYNSVSEWLENKGPLPEAARKVPDLDKQLRIQDEFAQKMRKLRYQHGALEIETIEPRAVMKNGQVVDLQYQERNRARELIEDFMIAANGVTAKFLTQAGYPTLRRVVRSPERWERIVQLASEYGTQLPSQPNSKALSEFLSERRAADALRFPDLSLVVVKLMGRGEYVLELPGEAPLGHFGLAVQDYTHSTAPNRRYPDLITQRLLSAAQNKEPAPYSNGELASLAAHCTLQENAAEKVERHVRKSASALFLISRVGEKFDGIVTGASEKGTFARVFHPPVEGMVVHGAHGLDVGDRVRLKLSSVNVEQGFIDFSRIR
jgi:exoribonuclease-2